MKANKNVNETDLQRNLSTHSPQATSKLSATFYIFIKSDISRITDHLYILEL